MAIRRFTTSVATPDENTRATGPDPVAVQRDLEARGLERDALVADPIDQFHRWFDDAVRFGVHQPEAMAVATATASGEPSVRLVLLRMVDARGFVFFTNHGSRKGNELAANPTAGIVFPWHQISRQVRVNGRVEHVDASESDAYFATRPRGSQLSAWASPQSRVVADRDELDTARAEQEARWEGREVARPPHWGGFRIVPDELEFWQGRATRFHDRFRYRLADPHRRDAWIIERLGP
jgi:pyridoxamine 5'-phosphate oxidase